LPVSDMSGHVPYLPRRSAVQDGKINARLAGYDWETIHQHIDDLRKQPSVMHDAKDEEDDDL